MLLIAVGIAAIGCSASAKTSQGATVEVFAASSLQGAFAELAQAFEATEAKSPRSTVALTFGATSAGVQQVRNGAPIQVFAAADESSVQSLVDSGELAGPPTVFATNRLVMLVEAGNPRHVAGLADLADPKLTVVLGAGQTPIGRYSALALNKAGVTLTPASFEDSAAAVVAKVRSGEADATIAYRSDAGSAGVEAVEIPDRFNVTARYALAIAAKAPAGDVAHRFANFVSGAQGRAVLAKHRFGAP